MKQFSKKLITPYNLFMIMILIDGIETVILAVLYICNIRNVAFLHCYDISFTISLIVGVPCLILSYIKDKFSSIKSNDDK